MFLHACEGRCDEALAFPSWLGPAVQDALAAITLGETHGPRHVFTVNVARETLRIPYRVYYRPDLLGQELAESRGTRRLVLACLGTRHHDGYLRQACLGELLASDQAWLTPYLVQLAGEYVIEIVRDVAKSIAGRDPAALAAFVRDNAAYLATLERRVTSYWNCYHRRAYPERDTYPGSKVLAVMRRVLA